MYLDVEGTVEDQVVITPNTGGQLHRNSIIFALFLVAGEGAVQETSGFERLAAVRFAVTHDFPFPNSLLVARETTPDSLRPKPAPTRVQNRQADASAIAIALAPETRVITAESAIECRRLVCSAKSAIPVLVVSDPSRTADQKTIVHLEVFAPAVDGIATIAQALVIVERQANGWVGVGYHQGPMTARLRIPGTP